MPLRLESELREQRLVPATGELGLVPRFGRGEPELLEPRPGRIERRFVQPGERLASPERERLGQELARLIRTTRAESASALLEEVLEPPQVEHVRAELEAVAVCDGHDQLRAERLAQLRHVDLEHLRGRGRRRAAPDVLDEASLRAREPLVEEEECEQRARLRTLDLEATVVTQHLQRAENAELEHANNPTRVDKVGPYALGRLLGEGATAHVFQARDERGRDLVVKILKVASASDRVVGRRFLHEARAAKAVSHRHLVPVFDVGESGGRPWLAMPFLPGGTLAKRLAAARLEVDAVARLAAELGGALDALHAAGILHRDVKPSNVLFDRAAGAALADFGLAKGRDYTALTRHGEFLGTPHYVAPELIAGESASGASDIYALGCVLYEAATGAPPFAGRSVLEVGLGHLEEEPPDPRERVRDLPEGIAAALKLALSKVPEDRPTTGHALAWMLGVSSARRR